MLWVMGGYGLWEVNFGSKLRFGGGSNLWVTGVYGLSQVWVMTGSTVATQNLDPPAIARDLLVVNDVVPEARWAYNLLEPAGEAKFREVVNAVRGMTAGL
ncbi:hypothetical protein B0H34DRAFT_735234 [Crassisporium funariophilum]|nr:hypothetical protein B0H34DRAFT_735234 [Crassisporium funariophilum]